MDFDIDKNNEGNQINPYNLKTYEIYDKNAIEDMMSINDQLPGFIYLNDHHFDFAKTVKQKLVTCKPDDKTLKKVFFDKENIKYIQDQIIKNVLLISKKYKIIKQNETHLRNIMNGIYHDKCPNLSYDISGQIKYLDILVINYCVPIILNNLDFRNKYFEDISSPFQLNTLPENVNNKGLNYVKGSRM